jgi:hypothetical protein
MKMKRKFNIIFTLIVLIFSSCSKKIVPTSLNNFSLKISKSQKEIMKSLNTSVEKIVNAGGNKKREKSIIKRIKELKLTDYTSTENIDWLSFQKNILINIKGETDKIIYVVSHYDKVDMNPLVIPSILLNGVLDPLISWSYTSDGAIDNATGVALSLQLAKQISKEKLKHNYRILLVGAEESGLRGSRSHVARLSDSVSNNIFYVINSDVIGVKGKKNCVTTNVSNSTLSSTSLKIAKELKIELGKGSMPSLACSDYASFKRTSFFTDFKRSLSFNLTGAFLPQRSYFTKKKENEIINFSSCELIDAGDYIGGIILLPIGSIHGFRDNIKLVDEQKLYEQFLLTFNLIKRMENIDKL